MQTLFSQTYHRPRYESPLISVATPFPTTSTRHHQTSKTPPPQNPTSIPKRPVFPKPYPTRQPKPHLANSHLGKPTRPTPPTRYRKMHPLKPLHATLPLTAAAGPLAYAVCQAGCASVVMACYAAAGATWGATAGATAPGTVVACNTAFGKCQAACNLASGFGP